MHPFIMVIEDDTDINDYLKDLLTENNYRVVTTATGIEGLKLLKQTQVDLILLDLTLPDMQGEGVCMEIRKLDPHLPIIMLTAKDAVTDKVKGLEIGADDYMTKPFVGQELIARIKARLRPNMAGQAILQIADLTLNPKTHEVKRAGTPIQLTAQEFKLLEYFMRNHGVVLSREMILDRVWQYAPQVETRAVDVYVGYLRKKIDSQHRKKLLRSIRGFGYTIKE